MGGRRALSESLRLALIVALAAGAVGYWLLDAPFAALTHHPASAPAARNATTRPARAPVPTSTPSAREPRPTVPRGKPTQRSPNALPHGALKRWLVALAISGVLLAGIAFLAALALLPVRLRARDTRAAARQRYEIIPYRTDVASPERMVQVYQALAATLNRRWFRRVISGVPTVAFEIHVLPRRHRPAHAVLSVVCTPEDARLIDSCLQIAYPDVRIGYTFSVDPQPAADSPSWARRVKRLKKRRSFITQVGEELSGAGGFEHQLTDALLVNLAEVAAPVTVQLTLTPAPRWVDQLAERAYRRQERRVAGARTRGELGERSPRTEAELRGGVAAQHQLLFYFDIRCASEDPEVSLLAAQSLSQGAGANRLRLKEPFLLERLHAARIEKALPRLFPPIRHGVLSSRELALLWQLPTHRPKSVTVRRSNLLREPASAAVWRPTNRSHVFARDERGPIGIRPADRRLGVRFTGVPGAGKTTGMVSLWRCDAEDRDGALIGFDPKTEAAKLWLSHAPADRKVYFLDLARPEFGLSPLMMRASIEVIGDTVVEGLRDINEEGAIMAASDRYLRSATYGALLLAEAEGRAPSWYDLYQQLWPEDSGQALRQRVCELCADNPDLAGLRAFYGTILPALLKDSRSQVSVRMDAPGNKIARLLGQPTINRMLHHPVQLSLDQVIDEHAVLIVQCSMGEVGEEQALIVLLMLIRELHTALQRQQLKPAEQRSSIYWHFDEAHVVEWPRLLEVILSTGRSAGLHPALAWQHAGQIEQQRIAKAILADLQTAFNYRCGDPEEAEEIAAQAMTAYLTRYSGEQSDRDSARFTPDFPLRITRHHALMQPIVNGEKDKPAVVHFDPMPLDAARIEHHLAAQRARGCFYPEDLPDPMPNKRGESTRDDGAVPDVAAQHPRADGAGASGPATRSAGRQAEPAPAGVHTEAAPMPERPALPPPLPTPEPAPAPERADERAAEPPPGRSGSGEAKRTGATPEGIPASLAELQFDDVRQIVWDSRRRLTPAPSEQPDWKPDDVAALTMLHRWGPLMITQIGRHVWPGRTERTVQRKMEAFFRYGLVNRFHMATATRHPYIYVLTEEGFKVAREGPNDDPRNYLDPTAKFTAANDELPDPKPADAKWRESELRSGLYVLHNLGAAGWSLAAAGVLGDACKRIHGGRESSCALRPPRGADSREAVAIRGNRSVGDLQLERFGAIWADARLDVHVSGHHMTHWYIECDRTGRPSKNSKKFIAYDAMFCGWGQLLGAYQQHLPIAVFVCMDERSVLAHLLAADRAFTGWVAGLVGKVEDRVYVGRQRTWFVTERDAHAGSLRAWRLPDLPPSARVAAGLAEKMRPVIKHLVPPERLAANGSRGRERPRRRPA